MDLAFDVSAAQRASSARWDRAPDRPLPDDALIDAEFAPAAMRYTWKKNSRGYYYTRIKKKWVSLHRFVWGLRHGSVPSELDHINRVRTDCRLENLRPLTRSQNTCGRTVPRAEGLPRGVQKAKGGYYSRFRSQYLGFFKTAEEASAAYERSLGEYLSAAAV